MAELGPATSRRARTGANYASQWNHFVAWSRASGKCSLPASPEDVAAYLEDRLETGARPSTLRVVAAIARNNKDACFDVPVQQGLARTVLDELPRDNARVLSRASPLDLNCYLANMKAAHQLRCGQGGRLERTPIVRGWDVVGMAMMSLTQNGWLGASVAAALALR